MPWTLFSTRNETVQIARGGWLDALRFIVAFLIILHHFQAAGPEPRARRTWPRSSIRSSSAAASC